MPPVGRGEVGFLLTEQRAFTATPTTARRTDHTLIGTIQTVDVGESFQMAHAGPNNMTQHELPTAATADWMYESLSKGPSLSLAKTVARTVPLYDYSFVTFASKAVSSDELIDFSAGGKADAVSADDWLFSLLLRMATASPIVLLVEDWRATRGDEFLATRKFPAIYFGSETYYLLRLEQRPFHSQHARIFSNTVPTFHAFAVEEDARLLVGMSLSSDDLQRIAKSVKAVLCGAYDGESYVVASRSDIRHRNPQLPR